MEQMRKSTPLGDPLPLAFQVWTAKMKNVERKIRWGHVFLRVFISDSVHNWEFAFPRVFISERFYFWLFFSEHSQPSGSQEVGPIQLAEPKGRSSGEPEAGRERTQDLQAHHHQAWGIWQMKFCSYLERKIDLQSLIKLWH
jgi:hypothetical protein